MVHAYDFKCGISDVAVIRSYVSNRLCLELCNGLKDVAEPSLTVIFSLVIRVMLVFHWLVLLDSVITLNSSSSFLTYSYH